MEYLCAILQKFEKLVYEYQGKRKNPSSHYFLLFLAAFLFQRISRSVSHKLALRLNSLQQIEL